MTGRYTYRLAGMTACELLAPDGTTIAVTSRFWAIVLIGLLNKLEQRTGQNKDSCAETLRARVEDTLNAEAGPLRCEQHLLSTRDCAKRLGVAAHRISYAHETGKLPDTRLRVAGKRVYTPEDVRRVADYFGVKLKPQEKRRRTNGK